MRVNYKDHRDIPHDIAEWVKSVAGVHNVYALDLEDINSLVNEYEEWQEMEVA